MSLPLLIIVLLLLAIIVSTLGSISGVGGGVLFVPVLLLLLPSYQIQEIKFISTTLVFTSSLINVGIELYKKNLSYLILIIGLVVSIPSIFLGNYLSSLINEKLAKIIIIVLLSIVSIMLIVSQYLIKEKDHFDPNKQAKKKWYTLPISNEKQINVFVLITISFFGCLVTSITGMGGGPLLMPLLIILCHLKIKQAAPISHSLIVVSSLISLITNYQMFGHTQIVLQNILPMMFGVIGGTIFAYWLKPKIKNEIIIKWILIILIWASIIKMIVDVI